MNDIRRSGETKERDSLTFLKPDFFTSVFSMLREKTNGIEDNQNIEAIINKSAMLKRKSTIADIILPIV
jgi:hypothetical protein